MTSGPALLVIDPDPGVASAIGRALKESDIRITSVASGDEAIEELDSGEFDIVICDLAFEEGRGFVLLKKVFSKVLVYQMFPQLKIF